MEFDHLFICVESPAVEAEQLIAFGLEEGSSNQHPGQGTANRRFFFHNAFIELLFVADTDELNSDLTLPTKLNARFSPESSGASPFGLCFRPSDEKREAPFQSWNYKPQYLPNHLDVKVAHAPSTEPMWFYLPFASRPDSTPTEKRQPLAHRCGFQRITSVIVHAPAVGSCSDAVKFVNNVPGVEFVEGKEHLLYIGFDDEAQGQTMDFRPSLPIVLHW